MKIKANLLQIHVFVTQEAGSDTERSDFEAPTGARRHGSCADASATLL
jgi:hypothetical protein